MHPSEQWATRGIRNLFTAPSFSLDFVTSIHTIMRLSSPRPHEKSRRGTMSDIRKNRTECQGRSSKHPKRLHAPKHLLPTGAGKSWTWNRQVLIWLLVACVPGLMVGIASYYFAVAPIERKLVDVHARQVAQELDAVVKIRSAAIQVAASTRASSDLTDTEGLDRLLQALRTAFPDFLSMEIMDEHGETLAMVGELPLSEASRSVGKSKTAKVGTMAYRERDLFQDDPEADSFLITAKHKEEDGKAWFSRTRFSRDAIRQALSASSSTAEVSLLQAPEDAGSGGIGSWKNVSTGSVVRLDTPGWVLSVEKQSGATLSSRWTVVGLLVAILMTGLAIAYRKLLLAGALLPPSFSPTPRRDSCEESAFDGTNPDERAQFDWQARKQDQQPAVDFSEESHDVSVPRKLPLALQETEEKEDLGTFRVSEHLSDGTERPDACQSEATLAASRQPGESESMSKAASACSQSSEDSGYGSSADMNQELDHSPVSDERLGEAFPDVLEVAWFEPDTLAPQATAVESETAEDDSAHLGIPEVLDVVWLEPELAGEKDKQPAEDTKRNDSAPELPSPRFR